MVEEGRSSAKIKKKRCSVAKCSNRGLLTNQSAHGGNKGTAMGRRMQEGNTVREHKMFLSHIFSFKTYGLDSKSHYLPIILFYKPKYWPYDGARVKFTKGITFQSKCDPLTHQLTLQSIFPCIF